MLKLTDISKNIINWPRFSKRLVVISFDLCLCVLCTWIAFYLRLEKFVNITRYYYSPEFIFNDFLKESNYDFYMKSVEGS